VPGQVLFASDVNSWFVPLAAVKGSNQSVTNSTVLVNDSALVVSVAASATYWFQLFCEYEGVNGADLKWQFTVPAGATVHGVTMYHQVSSGLGITWDQFAAATTKTAAGSGAGTAVCMTAFGTCATAGTAGSLQFQFAQNVANATATIVHAGSSLVAPRIA
jgi:hypothetical protein